MSNARPAAQQPGVLRKSVVACRLPQTENELALDSARDSRQIGDC